MKAVVLGVKGKKAAILSRDGIVSEVPDRHYSIGEEIDMKEGKSLKFGRNWTTAVAGMAAALLVFVGGGAIAYSMPASYVTLDVNPSIEYTLNFLDDVIDARALNEDGQELVTEIDWQNEDLDDVIAATIEALEDEGYLEATNWEDNAMIIGVTAKSESREDRLVEGIRVELQSIIFGDDENLDNDDEELGENVQVIGIGAERVLEAEALSEEFGYKVTPGKLNLVQKLDASMLEADRDALDEDGIEEWLDKPVKDIMKEIKANREAVKAELDDDAVTEDDDDDDEVLDDDDDDAVDNGRDKDGDGYCDKCTNECLCDLDDCTRENCTLCEDDCKCFLSDDDDDDDDEEDDDDDDDDADEDDEEEDDEEDEEDND